MENISPLTPEAEAAPTATDAELPPDKDKKSNNNSMTDSMLGEKF
jgi:hypothetical protein